jgi:hypothetical protein
MSDASTFWICIFFVAALLFFGTACVLAVMGVRDLRDLLRKPESKTKSDP